MSTENLVKLNCAVCNFFAIKWNYSLFVWAVLSQICTNEISLRIHGGTQCDASIITKRPSKCIYTLRFWWSWWVTTRTPINIEEMRFIAWHFIVLSLFKTRVGDTESLAHFWCLAGQHICWNPSDTQFLPAARGRRRRLASPLHCCTSPPPYSAPLDTAGCPLCVSD